METLRSPIGHWRVSYIYYFLRGNGHLCTRSFPTLFMPSLLSPNNFQKALQEYSSISEQLPSTNFAMKRDVQEGQARCLAHLGRHQEALEIAANLVSGSIACSHTFLCQGHQRRLLPEKLPAKGRIKDWDYRRKLLEVSLLT